MLDKELLEKNIIQILGIEALPDEKKLDLIDKLTNLVEQRVFLRIVELLPEDGKKELLEAIEIKDEQKVQTLISEKINNLDEILEEEIIKAKQEMQGVAQSLKA